HAPVAEPIHPVQSMPKSTLLGASAHSEVRPPVQNKPAGTLPDPEPRASRIPPLPAADDTLHRPNASARVNTHPPPSAALDTTAGARASRHPTQDLGARADRATP